MNRADKIIEELRKCFVNDHFRFLFNVSMYLAGDNNKYLRQEIVMKITGEKRPVSKCGIVAVELELSKIFTQYSIF